jgi:hypothetical protein
MSLDFPVIKRADLSPYIKEKKNCMDCCNPETINFVRKTIKPIIVNARIV